MSISDHGIQYSYSGFQDKDVDLLLVDTGDLHDGRHSSPTSHFFYPDKLQGTGISDGYPTGGVDGQQVRGSFEEDYQRSIIPLKERPILFEPAVRLDDDRKVCGVLPTWHALIR